MKIVVLNGGFSEEQYTSRESGRCVAKALEALGHNVSIIEYDKEFISKVLALSPDAVFHTLQGKYHGDGAVQSILELMGIKYVGSEPAAAAIINHKILCKKIWRANDINTPDFFEYSYSEYKKDGFDGFIKKAKDYGLSLPLVIKAPSQGGRFGMAFVTDIHTFSKVENSFYYDKVLLVERYVKGRFFTQGIIEINGKLNTLPPIETIDHSDNDFKTYSGGTSAIPHDLTKEHLEEINNTTLKAAHLTGALGYARLDYHLSDGKLYLLEIDCLHYV